MQPLFHWYALKSLTGDGLLSICFWPWGWTDHVNLNILGKDLVSQHAYCNVSSSLGRSDHLWFLDILNSLPQLLRQQLAYYKMPWNKEEWKNFFQAVCIFSHVQFKQSFNCNCMTHSSNEMFMPDCGNAKYTPCRKMWLVQTDKADAREC